MSQIFSKLVNNAIGTVQNNPLTVGGTNLVVDATLDAKLSGLGFPIRLTLWTAGYTPTEDPDVEIVIATARPSAANYTITRAQENTTAVQHLYQDNVGVLVTAGAVTEFQQAMDRRLPRVYSAASASSLTPEIDIYDIFHLTALAADLTINNMSTSTPQDGEHILIRLLDNGTPRVLSWGNSYVAKGGVALPGATTASKNMEIGFEYNANLGKWNLLAVGQES